MEQSLSNITFIQLNMSKPKKRHYNRKLFWIGFLMNIVRLFFLFIPALILIIVGIWVKTCLFIGLALLALVIIIAFVQQMIIKRTAETSDNPNFVPFAESMCSDNWQENVFNMVNKKIEEQTESDSAETTEADTPEHRQ